MLVISGMNAALTSEIDDQRILLDAKFNPSPLQPMPQGQADLARNNREMQITFYYNVYKPRFYLEQTIEWYQCNLFTVFFNFQ